MISKLFIIIFYSCCLLLVFENTIITIFKQPNTIFDYGKENH